MAPTAEREKEVLERVEEPDGYIGYGLYDPLGNRIGVVEKLFVSEFGEPQYIRVTVKSGLFRHKAILLPVERIEVDGHSAALTLQ